MTSPSHPGRLLEMSGAYWQTCALHAAVKLDLFTRIGRSAMHADEIAATFQADPRAMAMLLNALVAMKLLEKSGLLFQNSEESSLYLDAASPSYQGHIILHHRQLMASWACLDEAVLSGDPVRARPSFEKADTRKHFLMGMFNLAMGMAPRVVEALDLSNRHRLLDLGGGPGTYAIHFCQTHPDMRAVVFDLPGTRPFAEETITRFNLTDRIEFAAGDYRETPLPGRFDAIWVSHILHAETQENCRLLIRKAADALEAEGLMVIHDFFLNETLDGPLFPALFSLNMLLGTDGGQSYSHEQVETMMAEAGLRSITRLPLESPNDSGLLIGRK